MNYRHTIEYKLLSSSSELDSADIELVQKAKEALINAYAPYSEFKVGAAVQLSNGTVIKGNNQENAAYPSGLCAERVALFYAGANYPNEKIRTVCIVAKGDLIGFDQMLSPCGSCRQVMIESEQRQGENFRIMLINQDDKVLIFNSAADLLPFAFGK